jgi:uncharacterized protein involved in outer membrane biogenesis
MASLTPSDAGLNLHATHERHVSPTRSSCEDGLPVLPPCWWSLVLVLVFFPWDALRGPINRHVSDQLGGVLKSRGTCRCIWGAPSRSGLTGWSSPTPSGPASLTWSRPTAAEFDIKLLPLLLGRVELPRIALTEPQIGLQMEPDGRRTWALVARHLR